jgi:hypothetical protein
MLGPHKQLFLTFLSPEGLTDFPVNSLLVKNRPKTQNPVMLGSTLKTAQPLYGTKT